MISNKMQTLVANSSTIRAMFEEGKRLAAIHGAENVYDYSLGNPNVLPPDTIKKAIMEILDSENPNVIHGYMNNSGYEDVRTEIANFINKKQSQIVECRFDDAKDFSQKKSCFVKENEQWNLIVFYM